MILPLIIYGAIAAFFAIAQTNLLGIIAFHGAIPDLCYVVLVYFSFMFGVMPGQILGFASGLILDFLSLSPFGFHAFVNTASAHIIGRFKGVIQLDKIFLPIALVAAALILRFLVSLLVALILGPSPVLGRLFSLPELFEFLYTIVLTPLLFWPLRSIHSLIVSRKAYR